MSLTYTFFSLLSIVGLYYFFHCFYYCKIKFPESLGAKGYKGSTEAFTKKKKVAQRRAELAKVQVCDATNDDSSKQPGP